ncbi:hypothetical protein MUB04_15545 [Acinetobacter indicus]|uniref:hypothetical protein n=1 Tax=Acinetobacter TaxID=469 RepID=UPI0015D1E01B|nr:MULTISPECIES: hypothetical protein [Acinetobacter]MCP0917951.1 hypothetical protein [Acinetobacter indicus]
MYLIAFFLALGTVMCGYGIASILYGSSEVERLQAVNVLTEDQETDLKSAHERIKFGKIIIPVGVIMFAITAWRIFLMVIEPGSQ